MFARLAITMSVAAVTLAGPSSALMAQKGGKPKTDILATATFRCNSLNPESPCVPEGHFLPDAITGDGMPYTGVGTWDSGSGAFVRAVDGEFSIDLNAGLGRWVLLDFRQQVAGPSAPFFRKTFETVALDAFHLNTNLINPSTGLEAAGGLPVMPIGAAWPSRIKAGWVDTYGFLYNIRFNPRDFPGSTHVTVTRVDEKIWTIEASATDVARLVSPGQNTKGKSTGPTDEGLYNMPFKITVTVP